MTKRAQRAAKEGDDSEPDEDKPRRIANLYVCNDCGWRSLSANATGLPWPLVACESCSSLSCAAWPRGELEPSETADEPTKQSPPQSAPP